MRLRHAEARDKAYRILDLTSLTVDAFEQLVPACETAFLAYMEEWPLEGKPRTGRRYRQYATCPLPSPEDRLLFILSYLKAAPIQAAHGVRFGIGQPKANQWIPTLLPVLRQALAASGDLPVRTRAELQERRSHVTVDASTPFLSTTAPNARSSAPKTRMNKGVVLAARKSDTP
jgi:hypothetical protein